MRDVDTKTASNAARMKERRCAVLPAARAKIDMANTLIQDGKDGITGMVDTLQMDESEFHKRVDAILETIEAAFDNVEADIDSELNGGILTITFENGSKVIVNRQTPNREIWVAAKSGGFHFRFGVKPAVGHSANDDASNAAAAWYDTRSAEPLERLLSRVVSMQSESVIAITF